MMFGSLLSAGASLLGGMFQRKAQAKANARAEANMREAWRRDDSFIQRRVADAKKAGLHPLAALGAQGSSSYVTPIPESMGSSISDAGVAIGQFADKASNRGFQAKLNAATLRKINAETDLLTAQSRTAAAQAVSTMRGAENLPHPGPRYRGMRVAGQKSTHHQGWSDAERIEERYGNLVEALYGIGVLGADAYRSWQKWRSSDAIQTKGRNSPPPLLRRPGPQVR